MLDSNLPIESQHNPTYADILAQLNNVQESLDIAIDKGYPTVKAEGMLDVRMSDKDYLEWTLERINCVIYDVEHIQEKLAQLLQINCEVTCETSNLKNQVESMGYKEKCELNCEQNCGFAKNEIESAQ